MLMARIRSVHPTLFTDADWVECSPLARLLAIGLWTHADDRGVFVWRPKEIKLTLLPADNADVAELLEELVSNGLLMAFEHGGKRYGAIKNFRKWQRPQKPTAVHPLPENAISYVGLGDGGSGSGILPVSDQYSTAIGNPIQMEDVGCRRDEVGQVSNEPLPPPEASERFSEFVQKWPGTQCGPAAAEAWAAVVAAGADPDEILRGMVRTLANWSAEAVRRAKAEKFLSGSAWRDPISISGVGLSVVGGTALASRTWSGPPEIREAVVAEKGDSFAENYLDRAEWLPAADGIGGQVVTQTGIAADRLRQLKTFDRLRGQGVTLVWRKKIAA
jgi:hypothetical protein